MRRLGGKAEIAVDVRIVASTNRTLEEVLREGELREDLLSSRRVPDHASGAARKRRRPALLAEALIEMLNRKHGCRVVDVYRATCWRCFAGTTGPAT